MKKSKIILIIAMAGMAMFSACNSSQSSNGEGHEEHGEQEEGGTTVSITELQAEAIGLQLGKIEVKSLGNTVKVTGVLELFPQDRAEVSPFLGGNVSAINVIEGHEVRKGQILALMQHPDFIQMQQELQEQSSQLDYLKLEYERKERLYKEEIGSGREYQKAKSDYLSTNANVNGLKVKLQMLGLDTRQIMEGKIFLDVPIKAPIAGFIHLVNINLGEFAGPQMGRKQVMFEITDNSKLHVDLRVYEKDIHKVKEGQNVYFTVANHPDKLLEAKIYSVGRAFEDDPKSIHLHAEIENKSGDLLPGMYVTGRIVTDEQPVKVVPEEAVVTEGEQAFIFVQTEGEEHEEVHAHEHGDEEHDEHEAEKEEGHEHEDEGGSHGEELTFEKIEVKTGMRDVGYVEVKLLHPLPEDALVALVGAYTLSSEMIKGELEHEH